MFKFKITTISTFRDDINKVKFFIKLLRKYSTTFNKLSQTIDRDIYLIISRNLKCDFSKKSNGYSIGHNIICLYLRGDLTSDRDMIDNIGTLAHELFHCTQTSTDYDMCDKYYERLLEIEAYYFELECLYDIIINLKIPKQNIIEVVTRLSTIINVYEVNNPNKLNDFKNTLVPAYPCDSNKIKDLCTILLTRVKRVNDKCKYIYLKINNMKYRMMTFNNSESFTFSKKIVCTYIRFCEISNYNFHIKFTPNGTIGVIDLDRFKNKHNIKYIKY